MEKSRPRATGLAPDRSGTWQPGPEELLCLHRATAALFAHPTDYGLTVEALCRVLVPELADWCVLDAICDDGSLARVAVLHRDASLAGLADELRHLAPAAGPLDPERVAAEGLAEHCPAVAEDPELRAAREGPGRAPAIVRELGMESFLLLPLSARGRRLGTLTLARGGGPGYAGTDLAFAEELAARCALALDNARLFREAEEARRLAEQSARAQEDAARFGEQLLGVVSHDLRSPLAAILASTQLALKRAGGDEALVRALRRANSSASRMGRMIEELLDFTRARLGGGIPLRRREADLGKIARYAVEEAQAAYPEHPLLHRLHYERGRYDPDRMAQVVQNLIANGMQHGAPRAPVVVEVHPEGEWMVLAVTNQGPPIPAAQLPLLFEPFRRDLGGRARRLGLGLFIVQEVVRAHGGTVAVASGPERTTFTVRLPFRTAL